MSKLELKLFNILRSKESLILKLLPDHGRNISNAFKKLFWKKIFRKMMVTNPQNLTSFSFTNPVPFLGNYYEKPKEA